MEEGRLVKKKVVWKKGKRKILGEKGRTGK